MAEAPVDELISAPYVRASVYQPITLDFSTQIH